MRKRILVTGGAGFLGSHLSEKLLGLGHEVVCLDNFFTSARRNIEHLLDDHRFELLRHDVTEPIVIEVDEIYHLACPASPVHYQRNPVRTIRTCVIGTLNMLELCREVQGKLLIASTSEVYGDPTMHPQPESYWGNVNPIGVRGVYDEAKRFAEAITMAYHRIHGVDTRIIRIFNTYGPRMRLDDGRVVPNFIGQALRGEPLTVYGDGSQTRSFCYVSDLVEGMVRLLGASEEDFAAQPDIHQPVNVGNPMEMSIRTFADLINRLTGNPSGISFRPLPVDDPHLRRPDITRARAVLGWEPSVPVQEGLGLTIVHFRAGLQAT
jgi:UDP-glucuronate decarboxylase